MVWADGDVTRVMRTNGETTRLTWLREVMDRYEGPLLGYALRIVGEPEQARDVRWIDRGAVAHRGRLTTSTPPRPERGPG